MLNFHRRLLFQVLSVRFELRFQIVEIFLITNKLFLKYRDVQIVPAAAVKLLSSSHVKRVMYLARYARVRHANVSKRHATIIVLNNAVNDHRAVSVRQAHAMNVLDQLR